MNSVVIYHKKRVTSIPPSNILFYVCDTQDNNFSLEINSSYLLDDSNKGEINGITISSITSVSITVLNPPDNYSVLNIINSITCDESECIDGGLAIIGSYTMPCYEKTTYSFAGLQIREYDSSNNLITTFPYSSSFTLNSSTSKVQICFNYNTSTEALPCECPPPPDCPG